MIPFSYKGGVILKIRNYEDLVSHGNIQTRKDILDILNAGLEAIDTERKTKEAVRIEGGKLIVGGAEYEPPDDPQSGLAVYDLNEVDHIWVIGFGKGVYESAKALEEILGDRLTGGELIVKHGDPTTLQKIHVTPGGHPVPDEGCVEGCRRILELSKKVTERDIVFTISANGISSLLTMPIPELTLEEVQRITEVIQIEKGVSTRELNKVRNHVDMMKGGRVSRYFKKAQMIHLNLISLKGGGGGSEANLSGYEGLMRGNIWLHALPEGSTFQEAVDVLHEAGAWEDMSQNVQNYLLSAPIENETVKYEEFHTFRFRVFGIMTGNSSHMAAAKKKAVELGYSPLVLAQGLQAEAAQAGYYSMSVARSCAGSGEPIKPPCCIFTTGELLVSCGKDPGVGGRNQEYILAAATRMHLSPKTVIAAVDTDGTDGPGGFIADDAPNCLAGAIADISTMAEADALGLDISQALRTHNTSPIHWKMKNGIVTDQAISIGDFGIILIPE